MNETRRYMFRLPATINPIARQYARATWANMHHSPLKLARKWVEYGLCAAVGGQHFAWPTEAAIDAEIAALRAEFPEART